MSSYTYLGPADNLLIPGVNKAYHPKDSVSMTVAQKESLEKGGHRFAESKEADIAARIAASQPPAAETAARGDRGEVLDIPDARRENAPAAPSAAPATGAKSSE